MDPDKMATDQVLDDPVRMARMGWYVEVEIERFRKHGSQNFLSFNPDVHVQKCGFVGAFVEGPFYAAFV